MFKKLPVLIVLLLFCGLADTAFSQSCTTLIGQNPAQAIPVCGTKNFHQSGAASCTSPIAAIPSGSGCTTYNADNSFWYKFHCYQTGTLGFVINGTTPQADYDWEVFDITGRNPNDALTDASLQVSLNLYGVSSNNPPFPNYPTGCTAAGVGNSHCEGETNPFNAMPTILVGHDYLLMITNFRSSGNGYDLTFGGGTANITDPLAPHLLSARAACDGTQATIKLNKQMTCNSLSANGSEFFITPALANVIAASGFGCSNGFDMDSVILTLDAPLPPGNYTITIKNGNADGNTLKDYCDQLIPVGENIPLVVYPVFPTPMDSLTKPGCAPDELFLDFSKQLRLIRCSSIAADGSDFRVTMISGTTPVTVIAASGVCSADGLTPVIKVKLSAPIQTKGTYQVVLQRSNTDNNTIINECGQETPAGAALSFETKDTVNADFTYSINLGCKRDTINYFHDGRNEVNLWKWNFDNIRTSGLQNPSMVYATFGNKTAQLIVSNGVCKDTSAIKTILLDNDLKAEFEATAVVCPGDLASYKESSIGKIVSWYWDFGNGNTSLLQQPPQQTYPFSTSIRNVPVQLIVTNNLGCKDTAVETIKVVGNCYIAVPNAFTPNQDGINDYLYPLNAYKARDLIFKVYNRFGQLIFSTTDWTNKWDGTFKGQGADAATYVWLLQYTNIDTGKRIEQKGTTILIR
ncbi:T9SS type B sorting domain-containing protein [Ferruginibacter profundus]